MVAIRARRKFTPEFKTEAVRLVQQAGASIHATAASLGLNDSLLRRWVRESEGGKSNSSASTEASELAREVARLRKENTRLKMERDIIKKVLGYFAKDPE